MQKRNTVILTIGLLCATFISSCSAIAGIFKAGMGFGIFIVIALLVIGVVIAVRSGKSK